MEYLVLEPEAITRKLFAAFHRRQHVTKCRRRMDGEWRVIDEAFTDDWSEKEYASLCASLRSTAQNGGLVLGAFAEVHLKGFVAVEPTLFGSGRQYLDLSNLHVSEELRGQGVGRELFQRAKDWARSHGAKKLYLSAHSAVETQAFYRAMGCMDALEPDAAHVDKEPCDCQLDCEL